MLSSLFFPSSAETHEYRAPGPNDLRGPCPFLNTLANHGYIRRDGKRITWWGATKGIREVYHFSYFVSGLLAAAGIWTSLYLAWNPFYFDLKQLRVHSSVLVEHDASLSRQDYPADNWNPDPSLVQALIGQSSSPAGVNYQDFARHRISQEAKLSYTLSYPRSVLATGEVGLLLPSLGRGDSSTTPPLQNRIKAAWAKSFFQDERLPDDWTRPKDEIPFKVVNDIAGAVRNEIQKYRESGKSK